MNDPRPLIDVTLYVWGERLDPKSVTSLLGIEPTLSRVKGDKRITKTNQEITSKISIWTLSSGAKGMDLASTIRNLASELGGHSRFISDLEGVEGAYLDIHVVVSVGSDCNGQLNFKLSQQDIEAIYNTALPLEFTFDTVKD